MDNQELFGFTQPPHGQPRLKIPEGIRHQIRDKIKAEWSTRLTVEEIAAKISLELSLPISKNMVSGLAHRMNMEKRPQAPWSAAKKRKQKFNPTPKGHRPKTWFEGAKPPTVPFKARVIIPALSPIPMERLRQRTCRWPEWGNDEKPKHIYCGDRINPGFSYCTYHCSFAFSNLNPERIKDNGSATEQPEAHGPVAEADSMVRPAPSELRDNEEASGASSLTTGSAPGNPEDRTGELT